MRAIILIGLFLSSSCFADHSLKITNKSDDDIIVHYFSRACNAIGNWRAPPAFCTEKRIETKKSVTHTFYERYEDDERQFILLRANAKKLEPKVSYSASKNSKCTVTGETKKPLEVKCTKR